MVSFDKGDSPFSSVPPSSLLIGLPLAYLRALVIDLVKVFLLKSTNSDLVIINNITFSEESYEHVKQTIGEQLIFQLDVVFRTLRLLTEEDWKSPVDQHAGHATVHWRPHLLAPLPSPGGSGEPKK